MVNVLLRLNNQLEFTGVDLKSTPVFNMAIIIIIMLVGMSFAPLLLPNLDMWHAQGIWVQGWLMIAFSWSFFQERCKNIGLGLLHLWVGFSTLVICYIWQMKGNYNVSSFFPYFNFLCLLVMYRIIVQSLNNKQVEQILVFFKYVIIITCITCILQLLGLSQFFKLFKPGDSNFGNPCVGFIGNPTHLSGLLASSIPLFLLNPKRQDWVCIVLLLILLAFTGTTPGDPSISGPIIAAFIFGYYAKRKGFLNLYLIGVAIVSIFLLKFLPKGFFGFKERIDIWREYFGIFKQMPITGVGLGAVNKVYQASQHPNARHLHMEYFQYALELGLIGLALIVNIIVSFVKMKSETDVEWVLKASIFGFLISCCFNYPSHLWVPSSWALFCYAALHVKDYRWPYQENKFVI